MSEVTGVPKKVTIEHYIDRVLVGGNHLALWIGADHPSNHTTNEEALEHYGAGIKFDVWCCWQAIMNLRDYVDQERGVKGKTE